MAAIANCPVPLQKSFFKISGDLGGKGESFILLFYFFNFYLTSAHVSYEIYADFAFVYTRARFDITYDTRVTYIGITNILIIDLV